MKKRTFIKLCTAAAAMPFELTSLASPEKLTNWAGNIEYSTDNVASANSVAAIQDFVRKHSSFKTLGTRHCFNRIADSKQQLLTTDFAAQAPVIDSAARTITVGPGVRYGAIAPTLESKSFALHNLASLPHISVAGAVTTGTHGSGVKNGNLSTAVSALEIVNAAGDVITLSRRANPDVFPGAVVSLGALGVITKVTLNMQPTFQIAQTVYENLSLASLKQHFDEIISAAYSVSLFTDWQKQRVNEVWLKSLYDPGKPAVKQPKDFFGATRATKNLHPIAALSAENCTEQMGVPGPWYDRLPHFKMGFTPSAGKELQSEYFVPRQNALDAILAVEKLHEQVSPHLMITEIRTIAADDLWMSPAYKQDCVAIHFTWKPEWPEVSKLLPVIERELAPFKPRPHWGKLFTVSHAQLRASYEKLSDFIELARKFDPNGKFRNDFLNANIFGTAS
ncbi:MAG TPA: D-arabinono-1,4-lactone oxidase [Candidatus Dormibacteraeota bacterium]|jgi:xylitol oxidase|nr:D-arabinono-1,4-lactone oxidase [Candidatus Dormibacteraeota bacterium]